MEENIPSEKNESVPEQETSDMEVHHHPHDHHPHDHHAPKWQSYLFQFFMLFLAVVCGFLAEWKLDLTIEKHRGKQFMESLVHDLAMDTMALSIGFPMKEARVKAIDSVFQFFKEHPNVNTIPGSIHRCIRRATWDRRYIRNSGTIDQLKNAGGMRLIRNRMVVDSIAVYDFEWARLDHYKEVYFANQQVGFNMIEKLLNANDLLAWYGDNDSGIAEEPLTPSDTNVRINTAYLNEYLNFLNRQKNSTIQDDRNYRRLSQNADRLIKLIKREYRLH